VCGKEKYRVSYKKFEPNTEHWNPKKKYMDDFSVHVPVGNLNDLPMIRLGTGFVLIFGLFLILIVIITKEKKKIQ
jgi:hypothetical protein